RPVRPRPTAAAPRWSGRPWRSTKRSLTAGAWVTAPRAPSASSAGRRTLDDGSRIANANALSTEPDAGSDAKLRAAALRTMGHSSRPRREISARVAKLDLGLARALTAASRTRT